MRRIVLLIGLALASLSCFAQNGNNYAKGFAYIGALASIPSTCSVGSIAFITDATAGQNIYECASANTWTQQLNGGGGAPTGAAGGDLGSSYPTPTVVQAHWTQKALTFAGSPYTVLATDSSVNCNAAGGNVVINLPASTGGGKEYFAVKIDSSAFTCTVTRNGSDTIEGSATVVLLSQYDSLLIRDASAGSWLKVSPKIPGSAGNIIYNTNGSNFGAIAGTNADNSVDVTSANSVAIQALRTWTTGSLSNSMHLFDGTNTYTGSVAENTLSGIYITQQFQGTGGCGHCINFVSRIQYTGKQTVGATTDELDNYYADVITSSNPVDTVTLSTRYYALNGTIGGTGASTWANDAGFRNSFLTFNATPSCTVCQGFVTDLPVSDNAKIGAAYGLRIGGATKSGKYVAMGVGGGESYFTEAIEQIANFSNVSNTNLTTGGVFHSPIYSMLYQSNFCNQAVVCSNIDSLITVANGSGAATVYAVNGVADNGGNSNASLAVGGRFQAKNSGSATLTKSIGVSIIAPSNGATITDTSGIEIPTLVAATQTNIPIDVNLTAASSANEIGILATPISVLKGNHVQLTADWTCGTGGTVSSCATAVIVGSTAVPLTFTLPKSAQNYVMHCEGVVGQATAATANSWNFLTATNGATNVTASYTMNTAATAMTGGATTDQGATTTTVVIGPAWTLGGTGTKMPFQVDINIEGASASGTVVSLQIVAPTVADLVTIYRGATCTIN